MMTTSKKANQKSTTRARRSVHQTGCLCALCHELALSTTHRFVAQVGKCAATVQQPGLMA